MSLSDSKSSVVLYIKGIKVKLSRVGTEVF